MVYEGAPLLILLASWLFWRFRVKGRLTPQSVAIVVLGDIGRSPRMMYHAQSFATNGFETFFIGYQGSKPIKSLLSSSKIHFVYLSDHPRLLQSLPFVISGPLKVLHQCATILAALLVRMPRVPEFILVQNPPSIPTLAIVWAAGRVCGSKVIIDWHNLGYSVLAIKLTERHPFVKVAKWFEAFFGRKAYSHLFVSAAMRDCLVRDWRLQGHCVVLYDRPPQRFHRASLAEAHELFLRLTPMLPPAALSFLPTAGPSDSTTPFTRLPEANEPRLRSDRPALVVSSTSWTPDEDFNLLLEALEGYERRAVSLAIGDNDLARSGRLPKMLMVVTGKGPLKAQYMTRVENLQKGWKWVQCVSLWLEPEDYPVLLGSADLGICLHNSSSGLDLPMKVVDMFGCGLPVCALDYPCLKELVKHGLNGLVYKTASELTDQLEMLLMSFPSSPSLAKLRSSLVPTSESSAPPVSMPRLASERWEIKTWEENWDRVVRPLCLGDEGYFSTAPSTASTPSTH